MPFPSDNSERAIRKSIKSNHITVFFPLTILINWFPWYMGIAFEMLIIAPLVAAFTIIFFLDENAGTAGVIPPMSMCGALVVVNQSGSAVLLHVHLGIHLLLPPVLFRQVFHLANQSACRQIWPVT